MVDPGDRSEKEDQHVLVPPLRRRRRPWRRDSGTFWKILIAVLLLVGVGGAWLWLRTGDEPEVDVPASETADPAPSPAAGGDPTPAAAADSALDLPPLDASDEFVRRVAEGLSARPGWASWLATDDVIRRFVVSVVQVSSGSSPASRLEHLAPDEEFRVRESDGRTVIDPASYRRYDLLTATFVSLDNEGTARLFRQLHPLFEEAHRELGFPEGSFDDALARAVRILLSVEVPEGPVEVEDDEGVYLFRDPQLEALTPAEKHLLRMGPDNARRFQAKLRELADAMEIDHRTKD